MAVELVKVGKRYRGGKQALQDVTLECASGVLVLLGPRGAGKSTLLSILAGVTDASSGTVRVDGFDARKQAAEVRRRTAYISREPGLPEHLTVSETLEYGALLQRSDSAAARGLRIEREIDRFHLHSLRTQQLSKLREGERLRVAIARASLSRPTTLLLDDVTRDLEPDERVVLLALIDELAASSHVVLATSDPADARAVATFAAVLQHGELRYAGDPEALTASLGGRLWELDRPADLAECTRPPRVLVGQRHAGGRSRIRVVAPDAPGLEAVLVEPTLDDAYVWLISGGNRADAPDLAA
jgi:ABC-2 type transport system ATP-binding protein